MAQFSGTVAAFPGVRPGRPPGAPAQLDLDRCIHCGLCLNACPTYRELAWEMDSPRGRIYQMIRVSTGQAQITPKYIHHLDLCLACRACESACPSGVPYGRLIEAARAEIHITVPRGRLADFIFRRVLPSRFALTLVGALLYLYEASGLRRAVEGSGLFRLFGKLGQIAPLAPSAEAPFFFKHYGHVFPAQGETRFRVAFLGGCIANIAFARMHEAAVRVLQRNGCEVHVPSKQTCCGALHVHAGRREEARALARKNIDAIEAAGYDAIITDTAGCGSTLKEYGELLEDDPDYRERARLFAARVRDVNEFVASLDWNRDFKSLDVTVTYQDSCHLAHGQKIRSAPRVLLQSIPGLRLKEMPHADLCCGSAGVYNVVQAEMAARILESKMLEVNATEAEWVVTANPGCILQLRAGVRKHGRNQRVLHVVEVLDEAYRKPEEPTP